VSKLAVIVLGNRRSGKSTTWNTLFGRTVRTGTDTRQLQLPTGVRLPVFLVSGSPEERKLYVGDIIEHTNPRIVLCSLQYAEGARESVRYFLENGYSLYVQWLNPGYSDNSVLPDGLGFMPFLLHSGAVVTIRSANGEPEQRVREIRDFLAGWISSRKLTAGAP
jgi:hypothetical protein